ncbi:MAG: hypothetical protein KGL10_03525 [Alphaproteobacteria bacterium]|nr:hypothetical protein [Alphaproteobacteria bacterium]MDE2336360.1 hypothetical protein [Alphaproteobacteria bacterium]
MLPSVLKTILAAAIISFTSWLSDKKPDLAGFIVALPLTTLLTLLFSYAEYHDSAASVRFARSIFFAVPLSLLFFVPFLLANRLHIGFWGLYAAGIALLVFGYFAHKFILNMF